MPGMTLSGLLLLVISFALSGCDPFEQRRAEQAEKTRIECLDKICTGDTEPKRDRLTESVLKLNGQWYIAPREYAKGLGGLAFYWPSKIPSAGPYPEMGLDYYDVAIEVFLTGRQRWHDPTASTPWEGGGWEGRFAELQRQGLHIERQQIRPELERVRFFDGQGKQYRHEYFLATQQRKIRGSGPPGIACDPLPNPQSKARPGCSGGLYWQEDVYADFRFHAQHATDWPAIHEEIVRVLNLAKRAKP